MQKRVILAFIFGILVAVAVAFGIKKCSSAAHADEKNDYYLLTNQITKMNKMVVVEQDFSAMQKTTISHEFLGNKISNNQIITFTKTNAQVSYDLNQMKIAVDSVQKKLVIEQLPRPQIRITPNVEIQSMDDSFFNRINADQIQKVTADAKANALKTVDKNRLEREGKKQLLENLNHIFVLAKALHYSIVDQSKTLDPSNF